jgi:hypothetical protein
MVFSGWNVFLYRPEGQGATELLYGAAFASLAQLIEDRLAPFSRASG